MGQNYHVKHDNNCSHSARIVANWLENEANEVFPQTAQLTNLNPNVLVWDMLQRRIAKQHMNNIRNAVHFREILKQGFSILLQSDTDNLILSMTNRCIDVINECACYIFCISFEFFQHIRECIQRCRNRELIAIHILIINSYVYINQIFNFM